MGTHLKELIDIFPLNTNMTGFRWFKKKIVLVLSTIVASALEGLMGNIADPLRSRF